MLSSLASNPAGIAGAKAAVELGQYYIDNKDFTNAEKVLLEFTEAGTPHEFHCPRIHPPLPMPIRGRARLILQKNICKACARIIPETSRKSLMQ